MIQYLVRLRLFLFAVLVVGLAMQQPVAAEGPTKVVYHVSQNDQIFLALANARNHIKADPSAKITIVALYKGIDLLVDGKTDDKGVAWAPRVDALAQLGVTFKACKNTMDFFKITPEQLLSQAQIVPSGAAEIARLQAQEGHVYYRP